MMKKVIVFVALLMMGGGWWLAVDGPETDRNTIDTKEALHTPVTETSVTVTEGPITWKVVTDNQRLEPPIFEMHHDALAKDLQGLRQWAEELGLAWTEKKAGSSRSGERIIWKVQTESAPLVVITASFDLFPDGEVEFSYLSSVIKGELTSMKVLFQELKEQKAATTTITFEDEKSLLVKDTSAKINFWMKLTEQGQEAEIQMTTERDNHN